MFSTHIVDNLIFLFNLYLKSIYRKLNSVSMSPAKVLTGDPLQKGYLHGYTMRRQNKYITCIGKNKLVCEIYVVSLYHTHYEQQLILKQDWQ